MDTFEHDDLPPLDGLIAGTVALMTTWAGSAAPGGCDCAQRPLLARKIVSNLFFLQHHPAASPELRRVMAKAHRQWVEVAGAAQEQATPAGSTALPPQGRTLH